MPFSGGGPAGCRTQRVCVVSAHAPPGRAHGQCDRPAPAIGPQGVQAPRSHVMQFTMPLVGLDRSDRVYSPRLTAVLLGVRGAFRLADGSSLGEGTSECQPEMLCSRSQGFSVGIPGFLTSTGGLEGVWGGLRTPTPGRALWARYARVRTGQGRHVSEPHGGRACEDGCQHVDTVCGVAHDRVRMADTGCVRGRCCGIGGRCRSWLGGLEGGVEGWNRF